MNNKEFDKIVNDILINNKFKNLDNELHHGITRYGHSLRVSKLTFRISKLLKCNYIIATRAALLHDFYTNDDMKEYGSIDALNNHPKISKENAIKYFDISKIEENIIESHMFPLGRTLPKYKESFIVSLCDKIVALYEMARFKMSFKFNIYLMFIFNIISLKK